METEKRPVLAGLIALLSVALVIGVLAGLGIMVAIKSTGVGGTSSASGGDNSPTGTFYLPKPTDTGSVIPEPAETETEPGSEPTQSEAPAEGITLSASQVSVSPMQQIDLSGTYPTGEGAVLQVQRLENGDWSDFPVTMSVSGSTFATYVLTSRAGPNKFRVIDPDTDVTSNEVMVTVG